MWGGGSKHRVPFSEMPTVLVGFGCIQGERLLETFISLSKLGVLDDEVSACGLEKNGLGLGLGV